MAGARTSQGSGTTVASAVFFGLAAVCVALRLYIRRHIKVGIAWDDWWILIGLSLTLLTGSLLLWAVSIDPDAEKILSEVVDGGNASTFDTSRHTTYLKLTWICSILYFSIVTAIKISILLMYRRIFSVDRPFRQHSLALGTVVSAFWLATTIAALLDCHPLQYSWIGLSRQEYCFNYNIFWMITGAVEVVVDTVILALPVRMLLGLQLSRRSKVSIVFIFLLGGFVIITGILRVIYGDPYWHGHGLRLSPHLTAPLHTHWPFHLCLFFTTVSIQWVAKTNFKKWRDFELGSFWKSYKYSGKCLGNFRSPNRKSLKLFVKGRTTAMDL